MFSRTSERYRSNRLRAEAIIETLRTIKYHNRTDGYERVAMQFGVTVRFVRAVATGKCWAEVSGGKRIRMHGIDEKHPKMDVDPTVNGLSVKTQFNGDRFSQITTWRPWTPDGLADLRT